MPFLHIKLIFGHYVVATAYIQVPITHFQSLTTPPTLINNNCDEKPKLQYSVQKLHAGLFSLSEKLLTWVDRHANMQTH